MTKGRHRKAKNRTKTVVRRAAEPANTPAGVCNLDFCWSKGLSDIDKLRMCIEEFRLVIFRRYSKIPKTFILFPNLPFELRLKVWRSAFPPPQNVDLATPIHCDAILQKHQSPTPITLSINHESRTETLRHYHIYWGPQSQQWGLQIQDRGDRSKTSVPPVIFNLSRDKVFLDSYMINMHIESVQDWLKTMGLILEGGLRIFSALEIRDWNPGKHSPDEDPKFAQILLMFGGLGKLEVSCPHWRVVEEETLNEANAYWRRIVEENRKDGGGIIEVMKSNGMREC